MEKLDFLNGKKTYIVAIAIGVLTTVQTLGYAIPEWVWGVLAAAGLAAVRLGIANGRGK